MKTLPHSLASMFMLCLGSGPSLANDLPATAFHIDCSSYDESLYSKRKIEDVTDTYELVHQVPSLRIKVSPKIIAQHDGEHLEAHFLIERRVGFGDSTVVNEFTQNVSLSTPTEARASMVVNAKASFLMGFHCLISLSEKTAK